MDRPHFKCHDCDRDTYKYTLIHCKCCDLIACVSCTIKHMKYRKCVHDNKDCECGIKTGMRLLDVMAEDLENEKNERMKEKIKKNMKKAMALLYNVNYKLIK